MKSILLAAIFIAAFFGGAVGQITEPNNPFPRAAFIATLVGAALLFFWFRLDANERGFQRSALLNVGVVALAIVALPYYFFKSRGAKRGVVLTVVFVAAAYSLSWVQWLGATAAYHVVQS